MKILKHSKIADLFQHAGINNLRTMVAYACEWINMLSNHLSLILESIDNVSEQFGIPRWNVYYQRIVVPIKAPVGLY